MTTKVFVRFIEIWFKSFVMGIVVSVVIGTIGAIPPALFSTLPFVHEWKEYTFSFIGSGIIISFFSSIYAAAVED